MSKFTFICEDEPSPFGDEILAKRTVEFEASHLEGIIGEFETFLRGCGFNFDGYLEIAQTTPSEIKTNSTDAKIDLDAFTDSLFTNMHSDSTILASGGGGIDTITIGGVPFGINDNYRL